MHDRQPYVHGRRRLQVFHEKARRKLQQAPGRGERPRHQDGQSQLRPGVFQAHSRRGGGGKRALQKHQPGEGRALFPAHSLLSLGCHPHLPQEGGHKAVRRFQKDRQGARRHRQRPHARVLRALPLRDRDVPRRREAHHPLYGGPQTPHRGRRRAYRAHQSYRVHAVLHREEGRDHQRHPHRGAPFGEKEQGRSLYGVVQPPPSQAGVHHLPLHHQRASHQDRLSQPPHRDVQHRRDGRPRSQNGGREHR